MTHRFKKARWKVLVVCSLIASVVVCSKAIGEKMSSYSPVVIKEGFETIMARMKAAKPQVMKRQMNLLNQRYDLSDRPAKGITMSGGKPVQGGVRAKLP